MVQSSEEKMLQEQVALVQQRECKRPIVAQILKRLAHELPKTLRYHTAAHTDDVIHESLLFGVSARLHERQLELLTIAAAYHDAGFITQIAQNEAVGAGLAAQAMQEAGGYSEEEVAAVRAMIEDTQLKKVGEGFAQIPSTELSKFICDADLSNLGRVDFLEKAELVREEIGVPKSLENWERVLKLVQSHQWYTEPARIFRQEQKNRNVDALKQLIGSMRR